MHPVSASNAGAPMPTETTAQPPTFLATVRAGLRGFAERRAVGLSVSSDRMVIVSHDCGGRKGRKTGRGKERKDRRAVKAQSRPHK